jgi:tripartite ATP-independent transporter DctP family solute receptor
MASFNRRQFLGASSAVAITAPLLSAGSAHAADFTFKYANDVPASHPLTVAVTKASEQIRQKTGGRVDIKVFPNNQLGSDTDLLGQLRLGGVDFFTMSGLLLSTLVPAAAINGIAFAFKNYDEVWAAMDGGVGALVCKNIENAGLVVFDKIFDGGYRQITSSEKPIRTPEDLRGFKIRVPPSPLWVSMFQGLGASPTTINFSEVYSSLQTHVVDGQETPLVSIEAAKLYEVQKYCALTNHMWDGYWMLANRRSFAKLPDDLRRVVSDSFTQAVLEQRIVNAQLNTSLRSELSKKGLAFNEVDPQQFRRTLRQSGFYASWKEKFGPEAWAELEKSVGSLA